MSLFVNTNVSSLTARRMLIDTSNSLDTAFQRLSSGLRINSAADDAAGLQITDRMTSQVQGLNQAVRNANDGISVVQTAEGALDETANALQRIRVLTIQAQNGVNTDADRNALQSEVTALREEINRIAATSEFNGVPLLTGGFKADFLVGANANQEIAINMSRTNGYSYSGLFGAFDINLVDPANAATALEQIDTALSSVNTARADLGAIQNRFESTIRNLSNIAENVSAAKARIKDADFAAETAELTRTQILQQASTTILSQANQRPQAALQLLQG